MAYGYGQQKNPAAAAKKTFGGAPAAPAPAAAAPAPAPADVIDDGTDAPQQKGRRPDYRLIATDAEGQFIKGEDGWGIEIAAGWLMKSGQIRFTFPDGTKAIAQPSKPAAR